MVRFLSFAVLGMIAMLMNRIDLGQGMFFSRSQGEFGFYFVLLLAVAATFYLSMRQRLAAFFCWSFVCWLGETVELIMDCMRLRSFPLSEAQSYFAGMYGYHLKANGGLGCMLSDSLSGILLGMLFLSFIMGSVLGVRCFYQKYIQPRLG